MPEPGRKALLRKDASLLPPAGIAAGEIESRSRMAQSHVLSCFPPKAGDRVAVYAALPDEVGTGLIADAVRRCGGTVYYPRIEGKGEMAFYPCGSEESLVPGPFGIPAPVVDPALDGKPELLDLVVVPGKAFDPRGNRLGRGGGYYDRFLSRTVARKVIGLAFSWQIVQELPIESWDVPMDAVVTERGVIRVSEKVFGSPRL
jgi:5-formyltetrahydrofolate cyclo-ligase